MLGKLIYIASPFTHDDKLVMIDRFEKVAKVSCYLMSIKGIHVFSPIAHGWPIAEQGDLPTDWTYWEENCTIFITRCQELWVVMLDGWKESTGVLAEVTLATSLGLPIKYVDVSGDVPVILENYIK